ncbi:MAG: SAM-dependent methyltransferase [Bacteroidales bacterium]|nr:SAM-dependent methyltransferase [Bacteroidales bacterium]
MEKSANIFRFKKFQVVNECSAMKVNTDGVLLGAAMTIRAQDRRLLDIGTGTGTIALMAAQRLEGEIPDQVGDDSHERVGDDVGGGVVIDAVEIDGPSAVEAAANFSNSPWPHVLNAYNMSLDRFAAEIAGTDVSYDLIFSNPPYFEDSQMAPDSRKSTARHTGLTRSGRLSEGLSYRDIFDFAAGRLTEDGRVALILPADQEAALTRYARMSGLHLFRILRIRTVPRKAPIRIVAEFSRYRCETPQDEMLTIMNEGKYTEEYLSLIRDFYLFA